MALTRATGKQVTVKSDATGGVVRSLHDKLSETVSVKDFGAVGDGVTNDQPAIFEAWTYCLANAKDMYFPSGTYVCQDVSFPMGRINGLPPSSLLDCKGITIFGDGNTTVLKTISSGGADVLQFNGAKNLTVKNLAITSELTGLLGAGSNAVSITGGCDNLTFENVKAFDLAYVDKSTYLDGGKGFTIQLTNFTPEAGTVVFQNCVANGCVYGFDINPSLDDIVNERLVSRLDNCIAENCWYGFLASAPAATVSIPEGFSQNITMSGTAINCQHSFTLGRVHGGDYNINVINTKTKADLKLDYNGTAWSTTQGLDVDTCIVSYLHNGNVFVHGFANTVDYKVKVGGTAGGTVLPSGTTYNSSLTFDIGGTSDVADVSVLDYGGNTVYKSTVVITPDTTSSVPSALYTPSKDNSVTYGTLERLNNLVMGTRASFAYTDGISNYNHIERDGLGIFVQGAGASSGANQNFGVKDHNGNKVFAVTNNGGLHSAATATASSVSTVIKAVYFYDASGNIQGFIPVYSSFA